MSRCRQTPTLVQHRRQRFVAWRRHFDELRPTVATHSVGAVQHRAVQVDVQVGVRGETLDQRDRTAVGLLDLLPNLADQVARDDAVHHLQHRRHPIGLCDQQPSQRDGPRRHPWAHRHLRDDAVHQVRCHLRHAASAAGRTEAAPLAAERDELGMAGGRVRTNKDDI